VLYCATFKEIAMILGMSTSTFTTVHVVLSLIGIASGVVVLYEMIRGRPASATTAVFLVTTVLTSVTGYPILPFGFDPPRAIGTLSLALLALAILSLYVFKLAGHWRWIYVTTATAALYLNCFVGVVQTFQKIAFFNALAPTQTEPPFAIAQVVVLVLFIAGGVLALRRFSPGAPRAALSAR
jgi:hypothetical protein